MIVRLGRELHPDHPYDDPRVNVVTDDARHFLRTTKKKYDLVVFALIDSLTLQSSFASVRLESYMFTEESFRAVKDRLKPGGVLVIYNYFRERWLVDRLANTAATAFGTEPRVHIHKEHSYLGVLMVGPGLSRISPTLAPPDRVEAYNHPDVISPGVLLDARRRAWRRRPTTGRSSTCGTGTCRRTTSWALALVLVVSVVAVRGVLWGTAVALLVALLLPRRRLHAARDEVDHPVRAVVGLDLGGGVAGHPVGAGDGDGGDLDRQPRRDHPALAGRRRPAGAARRRATRCRSAGWRSTASASSRRVYALLMFSPILCAGLLFGSSLKRTPDIPAAYGANLLGAMVGGVAEYLSLVTGLPDAPDRGGRLLPGGPGRPPAVLMYPYAASAS